MNGIGMRTGCFSGKSSLRFRISVAPSGMVGRRSPRRNAENTITIPVRNARSKPVQTPIRNFFINEARRLSYSIALGGCSVSCKLRYSVVVDRSR